MWSNDITDSKFSFLKIAPTENSCLYLYTSLCNECFLEVTHNATKQYRRITATKPHQNYTMNLWQTTKLDLNSNEENLIWLQKQKSDKNINDGYWAVDYGFCDYPNKGSIRV